MENAVASGHVDFALTYLPIAHGELDFLRIQPIEMGIFGLKQKFTEILEKETPFVIPIVPIEGSPNKVRGLDGWPEDAFARKVVYRVGMLETALGICRQGLAVAYIPKFIARLHNEIAKSEWQLEERPLPVKFPQKQDYVYLVKRRGDLEGDLAKKLGLAVRKFCKP